MAFRHGKEGDLSVNGTSLSDFVETASFTADTDIADTNTWGHQYKRGLPGQTGGKLDVTFAWDPTNTTGPAAILEALVGAAAFPVIYYPGGNVSGQRVRSFNAILASYGESTPVGDAVTLDASFQSDDTITFDDVS